MAFPMFQSAPLTEARGDVPARRNLKIAGMFQSAPLTEARGDVLVAKSVIRGIEVSIRSPDRSQGRFGRPGPAREWINGFNPLP